MNQAAQYMMCTGLALIAAGICIMLFEVPPKTDKVLIRECLVVAGVICGALGLIKHRIWKKAG